MPSATQSPFTEGRNEILARRNAGEDISLALEDISDAYGVPIKALKEWCETQWGAPIETDTARNAEHFAHIMERKRQEAAHQEYCNELMSRAKQEAASVWYHCSPDGEPNWHFCCEKFLKAENVSDRALRGQITSLFLSVDRDFSNARRAYKKLIG